MHKPPTGTVTFLFTDIEGSTRLWQDHPDQMRPALARHDALLRQAVVQSGGYVVKATGDGIHVAFSTAPEALAGALGAQFALNAEPWGTETPLRVRMALHTGNAEERNGDYYGPSLNRVARLLAAGRGGQVLISAATQELVRDQLPTDVTLSDLGETSLKDLTRPERVFQLLHPDLPADFPPLRSLDNPDLPNNLPQQPTSFIGREKELTDIIALLGKTRLLTLTGAGGSGKTRLSLQVAADLLDGEGDGVWLVELASLSDPALVPQAVADVLGVREEAGKPIQQTLVEALKAKHLLLVLDNCEHLVAACAFLAADLLKNCPHVHILASSRESLNVAGEQAYRVPSLTLPDPKQAQTVESLTQYEAVRLFIERAKAVQPLFTVTDTNAPAVAQVCFHLDGIPLAIELAAARVRSLSVEEINARLDHRFRLLTGGARNTLPRQQTLRALIDWSYDSLGDQEKTLLCRLSVFAGGCTLSASEAVCLDEGAADWEMLDLLTSLVDKSLVVYEEGATGTGRYHLLETVRQYGRDRLAEAGETETIRGRHATWALALAQEAEPQLTESQGAAWLGRLETEHDNLRAALDWCETWSDEVTARAEAGLRLSEALWSFWELRGHYSEGRRRLEAALSWKGLEEWTQARVGALFCLGCAATIQGELGAGRNYLEQVAAISCESGDRRWEAASLNAAANVAIAQGELGTARSLLERSLKINRERGSRGGEASNLVNLGAVAIAEGDMAAARACFEQSLAVHRESGDRGGEAGSLGNLGYVACAEGHLAAARDHLEQSLAIDRGSGYRGGEAGSLGNLGGVALAEGDLRVARNYFEQALAINRDIGDRRAEAADLTDLGRAALTEGDMEAARNHLEQSLAIGRRSEALRDTAYTVEEFAALARAVGDPLRSARLAGAAQAVRETISHVIPPEQRGTHEQTLATARAALGDEAFAAAWAAGRAMTLEQAVEYALSAE